MPLGRPVIAQPTEHTHVYDPDQGWVRRNEAPNLFDAADMPVPVSLPPKFADGFGTIQDAFEEFHRLNPWVYTALCRLARDMHGQTIEGRAIGIGMLWEVLRWQYTRATCDRQSEFNLNNNYRSRYARLIMEQEADLDGVFQIRELTTP